MTEILEATMLICFGASWPISLIKNIKAKTAKSMSLQFLLLIITGYIAGISAKLINHNINYVLVIYLLNLIVVSFNLIVYFINRRNDQTACAETLTETKNWEETKMSFTATNKFTVEKIRFQEMNHLADKDGIVFFGSTYLSGLPLCELAHLFHIEETIYNRSITDMAIDECSGMLDSCVLDLNPQKVFVNLGDADLRNPHLNIEDFLKKYEWLLYTIHTKTKAELYVLSVHSDSPLANQVNMRLKQLAYECGSVFIDTNFSLNSEKPELQFFSQLKPYIRNHALSFSEAMDMVTI